jgi:xanthine/CO dehydrogenase XdhC/CoxF family maturation factor
MKEIRDILRAFDLAATTGKRCALATVVHVEGSSYRRPGARMLVTEDGELTGAISGGCLEGDALRKALYAISQQQNKLVTYDTTDEDDLEFGVQLGCNGIVHILFEPIVQNSAADPIGLLREVIRERRDAVLLTLFSLDRSAEQPGTCLLHAGDRVTTVLSEDWRALVAGDVLGALAGRSSGCREYEYCQKQYKGFVEFITPPPAVVIAGAGNDVLPLVDLTVLLGWHTTVVDGRPHYVTPRRFGKADKIWVAKPNEVLGLVRPNTQTLFLLMTHNYNYDLALLKALLPSGVRYIGILGPRKKLERMLEDLRSSGMRLDDEQLAAIHSPVGLDIGAETAEEIAVSIVAEIKAVLSHTTGDSLKVKSDPIHSRTALPSLHE